MNNLAETVPTSNAPRFKHQVIDRKTREIRLVQILPDADDGLIRLRMKLVNLGDYSTHTDYNTGEAGMLGTVSRKKHFVAVSYPDYRISLQDLVLKIVGADAQGAMPEHCVDLIITATAQAWVKILDPDGSQIDTRVVRRVNVREIMPLARRDGYKCSIPERHFPFFIRLKMPDPEHELHWCLYVRVLELLIRLPYAERIEFLKHCKTCLWSRNIGEPGQYPTLRGWARSYRRRILS